MIKKEREKARLSQADLANRAGLPARQSLTEIEAGKREVKAWELAKIAQVLGLDIHHFFSEGSGKTHSYILWRQLPRDDKRQQLENDFFKKCEDYALVERLTEQKNHLTKHLPQIDLKLATTSYNDIFPLADETREILGLAQRPACLLMRTLEEEYAVKIFVCPIDQSCSAASAKGSFGSAILLNSNEPIWRRNYSCAHELFHLITWNEGLFESLAEEPNVQRKNEQLADVFAAGLLMPASQVKLEFSRLVENKRVKYADLISLAAKYEVSTIAFLWRLHNLGCIPREIVEKLQSDETFKDLDRTHRLNQESAEDLPARFVRLAFQAVTHAKLSKARAADMLGVSLIDLPETFKSAGFVEPEDDEIEVSAA